MADCPYCGFKTNNPNEEVTHMSNQHPEVVRERLAKAGMQHEIVDYRQGPDLPSYLTLKELQCVFIFATKFAIEQEGDLNERVMIGIHIRDRGNNSRTPAPWIEFEVGPRQFALWRETLDLYEVGPDGAVDDEPLHWNERD